MENLQKEPSGSPTNAQAALKKNTRVIAFWFFALVAGGFLGWLQIGWLNELFGFIATVFTRLFKFVAVPVIALAVITTLSQLGAKRETKQIFAHAIFYTLATTFAAALVALGLFILIAPENVPLPFRRIFSPSATTTTSCLSFRTTFCTPSLKAMCFPFW